MKKGLRQLSFPFSPDRPSAGVRIAALMKKGLRPITFFPGSIFPSLHVRIAALMKKGLRLNLEITTKTDFIITSPNCCPDEEGIKTPAGGRPGQNEREKCPNCCPDEEGIKTLSYPLSTGRPPRGGPNCCPDEEGIKTACRQAEQAEDACSGSELLP